MPVHCRCDLEHIPDFDPKLYIRPRKSLKVMSREIQMGFAAADMAMIDASLATGTVDPDRFGVVFGSDMIYADLEDLEGTYRRCITAGHFDFSCWAEAAAEELQPLWLLKHLPNMTASHIAIARCTRPQQFNCAWRCIEPPCDFRGNQCYSTRLGRCDARWRIGVPFASKCIGRTR